ncbi:hypothetical protein [Streptomyces cirratus]|uniref:hypothetical protein n=1 Tax=Streptomyces cirratus TaxID=68187 RepID=UPI00167D6C79|nr:hypothetical protein [Streptomyces cirratus]
MSVGALLASCAAASAVSTPPARVPVRPASQEEAAGAAGTAMAAGAREDEQAAADSEAA